MKKKLFFLFYLFMFLISGCLVSCNQAVFSGNYVKTSDTYMLVIEKMTGEDSHTLLLNENDVLDVHFETIKGTIKLTIVDEQENEIYSGDGTEVFDFVINIRKSGEYTFYVNATKAKGALYITLSK